MAYIRGLMVLLDMHQHEAGSVCAQVYDDYVHNTQMLNFMVRYFMFELINKHIFAKFGEENL